MLSVCDAGPNMRWPEQLNLIFVVDKALNTLSVPLSKPTGVAVSIERSAVHYHRAIPFPCDLNSTLHTFRQSVAAAVF